MRIHRMGNAHLPHTHTLVSYDASIAIRSAYYAQLINANRCCVGVQTSTYDTYSSAYKRKMRIIS